MQRRSSLYVLHGHDLNDTDSEEYDPIHPPDAITSNLPLEKQ